MPHATTRPRKSIEDLLALPEGTLAEFIDGELYVNSAPRPVHQRVTLRIAVAFMEHVESRALGEAFVAPIDVFLPTGDVVEPDVVVVLAAQAHIVEEDAIHGVPQLLVEVLSPSNPERDRVIKMKRYAQCRVPEYWIVDPDARGVEVFAYDRSALRPAGWFTGDERVISPSLPDLNLSLAEIFRTPGQGR